MTPAILPVEQPATLPADNWCTPHWLIERIVDFNGGAIGLDPASNERSLVAALVELEGPPYDADGLEYDWCGHDLCFCNPPYSRGQLDRWTAKMCVEADRGAEIIGLVPATTATRWWQSMAPRCQAVLFLGKRVRFVGDKSGSPRFDSALIYFGERRYRFAESMGDLGWVVLP